MAHRARQGFGLVRRAGGRCVHARECIQTGTVVFYDTRDAAKFDALLNLIRMVVVMVVLTTAVVVYTQDATVLVVGPIERMMSLVRRLAENPLGNMSQRKRTVAEKNRPDGRDFY